MNVTSYLSDDLVESIDQLAREQHSSRSAVIRRALEMYLRRREAGAWPQPVRDWQGDPGFAPFESLRGIEQAGSRDPFEHHAL